MSAIYIEAACPFADPACPKCHGTGDYTYLDMAGEPHTDACDCLRKDK